MDTLRLAQIGALLASTSFMTTNPALAQETTPSPSVSPMDPSPNSDIVVTATRRSERLQDVPISIQALSSQTLQDHQIKSIDDYNKLLPSVSYQSFGPSQSQLYFRGITTGSDILHIGPQPTTGIYLDEIPVTTIVNSVDIHVYDISRIEALSGPQGTLFGSSSEAGTLRIITNKPDASHFSAGYDFEGNKFGSGQGGGVANAFVNVPLAPDLAIRLVGFYEHDGGYIDNVPATRTYDLGDLDPSTNKTINNQAFAKKNFNHVDSYGGRIALKYDINENWSVTPQLLAQYQKTAGNFLYDPRVGDLKVNDFFPEMNVDKWYQAALTIQGKLSNWDVTYAGSYFQRQTRNRTDYSFYTVAYDKYLGSFATYFPTGNPANPFLDPSQQQYLLDNYRKHTEELRISSPANARLRLTAGMFLERQSDQVQGDYFIQGISTIPTGGPSYVTPIPGFGDDVFATRIKRVDRDYAVFAEASLDILKGLTLTGGIRGYIFNNTLNGGSGFGALNPVNQKLTGSGETHKVNLTWKVGQNQLLYASYSTGFRPGGANRFALPVPSYKTDTLDNYEVGFKTSWLQNRLHVNGALFYENWNNPQLSFAPAGLNGATITTNVGGARSKGVEADASLALGNLVLSGSGTYVDAYTTKDFASSRGVTPSGTRLPVQPRFKVNGTARYTIPIGALKPYVQASVLHQSNSRSFLIEQEFENIGTLPGFTTIDFAAGTTLPNRMTIEFFIQNAFDERGQLSRNTACAPALEGCAANYRVYPVKPQYFGVRFGQRF